MVANSLRVGFAQALDSGTFEEAWDSATLAMKNTLRDRIVEAFLESEAMKHLLQGFNDAVEHALRDGVISEGELRELERIFAESEGPLHELWNALEALGLGFNDLNESVNQVTRSMSNVPNVFLDVQAMYDSLGRPSAWEGARSGSDRWAPDGEAGIGVPGRTTITIQGDVYGWDDFESKVQAAIGRAEWRGGLSTHGVPRVG